MKRSSEPLIKVPRFAVLWQVDQRKDNVKRRWLTGVVATPALTRGAGVVAEMELYRRCDRQAES